MIRESRPKRESIINRENSERCLYLIRHGETDEQFRNQFIGRTNVPLSQEGKNQACLLSAFLEDKHHISCVSSPLDRARETAEIALSGKDIRMEISDNLREINFGSWEGMTFDQMRKADPERIYAWVDFEDNFSFPKGESISDFSSRLSHFKEEIISRRNGDLLIVTHGGVIRMLICLFLNLPLRRYIDYGVEPASITTLILKGRKFSLQNINNTSHLLLSLT